MERSRQGRALPAAHGTKLLRDEGRYCRAGLRPVAQSIQGGRTRRGRASAAEGDSCATGAARGGDSGRREAARSFADAMITAALGDFCETGSGTTPSREFQGRYYTQGTIPWVKSGELRESLIMKSEEHVTEAALRETGLRLVSPGTILLAMYGATVGRLGILGVEATTNQAICHIVPDRRRADSRYLFHALRSRIPDLLHQRVGGAQRNINQRIIRSLTVRKTAESR